ncbi:MAG: carbamoyl-phosphate synthase (glutamine-hydrolyzing) large subunit [Bdellovibrionota bacterium]
MKEKPKIVVLGSGGLSIGQAGEFDYSGTQAVKALAEEGCDVIVINPNIATVQTNPSKNVKIYLYPVTAKWVEVVFAKEKPDAIVASFGGQTALNCLIELDDLGILDKYNVKNLGTSIETLKMTEDRDLFAKQMKSIGMPIPPSVACSSLSEALVAANDISYPVIVRAAYALGGLGSGFANNDEELKALVEPGLAVSPQVLIEKSLKGWKEVEYEVMRDGEGNCITICNMENFDPLGIHTGDSIVVCPSQSLSDDEYQLLRNAALKMINSMNIIGECNAQFALDPNSLEFYVIEVNARLSRSSALASKASGYPIAYIAAKVVLGHDLLELKNPVTGITCAFYEPALDYVTIKMPRWDLQKFKGVVRDLGSTMKSVGEVMAIGRSFPEALQKAVRMVSEIGEGISSRNAITEDDIRELVSKTTDTRLYAVVEALRDNKMTIDEVHAVTFIDKWFLSQIAIITSIEKEIAEHVKPYPKKDISYEDYFLKTFSSISCDTWRRWKSSGFADLQIVCVALRSMQIFDQSTENERLECSLVLRKLRKELGVYPVVKKIDTTAAEYPSPSNYLYFSYGGLFHDPLPDDKKKSAVVLGGGSYRIGTSVEFDWCAVSCSERLQADHWRSVIVNCNPETVSTDFNCSDRLYFDEISVERVLDIYEFENAQGVIASMGGQLPNKIALPLAKAGVKLLGHSPETIDHAEDRNRFSALLDSIGIDQPKWVSALSKSEIDSFIDKVGFPVLVRPSYVLSGAAMKVAYDRLSLDRFLEAAVDISSEHPVVISEFLTGAREIELDGVARDGKIVTGIVSEHIENAGIHSGDATTVVPAQMLYVETVRQVKKAGRKIAEGLKLNGPFNIQFLAKEGQIKVIECNARAARSFPFISKSVGLNLAEVATDVIIGKAPKLTRYNEDELPHVGVKAAMFSFGRLKGADPVLGVEMASTGEVGCIGRNFEEALLLALEASKVTVPKKGILVSAGAEKEKILFLKSCKILKNLGLKLYATNGTAKFLQQHGFECESLAWPGEAERDVLSVIKSGEVDFVVNIPKNTQLKELTNGAKIRQCAVQFGCAIMTNMEKVTAFVRAIDHCKNFEVNHDPICLPQYHA